MISPIKKWLACNVQSSSYRCTREVAKHEGNVKSHEAIAECKSKLLDCLPPKHIHTRCLHDNHFFYNFETFTSFVSGRKKGKQTDVSVQLTSKWIERISQSERTLLKIYVIKYQVCAPRLRCIVVASFLIWRWKVTEIGRFWLNIP